MVRLYLSTRVSLNYLDPNFLAEQPGIIEISDESMTSVQKTLDDDNQRQSHQEIAQTQDATGNYQQQHNFTLKLNKAPSQPTMTKDSERKDARPDSGSSRKDDMPLRLTRSSSSILNVFVDVLISI